MAVAQCSAQCSTMHIFIKFKILGLGKLVIRKLRCLYENINKILQCSDLNGEIFKPLFWLINLHAVKVGAKIKITTPCVVGTVV